MVDEQLQYRCRLCGVHESKTLLMVNIFQPENYVPKIHKLIPVSINEYDPLPKKMCYTCLYKIEDFSKFSEKCVKTQDLLKKQLSWCQNKNLIHNEQLLPPMQLIKDGVKISNTHNKNNSNTNNNNNNNNNNNINSNKNVEKKTSNSFIKKTVNQNDLKKTIQDKLKHEMIDSNKTIDNKSLTACTSTSSLITTTVTMTTSTTASNSTTVFSTATTSVSSSLTSININKTAVQDKNSCVKSVSTSNGEPDKSKREKLTLTLKKNEGVSDSWSVPSPAASKRKRSVESHQGYESQHTNADEESVLSQGASKRNKSVEPHQDTELHHMNIDGEIHYKKCNSQDKTTETSSSSSSKSKKSNLKEHNGQEIKRNDAAMKKSDSLLRPEPQQSSKTKEVNNINSKTDDSNKEQIPDYLMVTKIPMSGTVYTCFHCEQTFVSQTTACTHKCNKLLHMLALSDNPANDVKSSVSSTADVTTVYVCELCNQTFSRQASLTAHQSVHYTAVVDYDSDACDENFDENIVFYGQKRKKKSKIVRKVIQDQDGNYL
ncbi:uncharacterized protein LOC142324760 isoform X2 [Lycorma delicatula]|uniref:uncharacterized protein LOC142324760 isoform X2 n=1 Tax=Lycorma delicatula TaxID=130591 RepID=UPI003F510551